MKFALSFVLATGIFVSGSACCAQAGSAGSDAKGFKFETVEKGSVYEKLGLRRGDVVKSWNGHPVRTTEDTMSLYKALKTESKIDLVIERDGQEKTLHFSAH